MDQPHLAKLPSSLRQVLTNLPVFYLLEFLGRNPGTWETAWGLSHRVGITQQEASDALERLVEQGYLTRTETPTGDRIYRLSPDPAVRCEIVELADRVNRNRDAFLHYVREILRLQSESRHA